MIRDSQETLFLQKQGEFFSKDEEIYIPNFQEVIECNYVDSLHKYSYNSQGFIFQSEQVQSRLLEDIFFSKNEKLRIFIIEGAQGLGKTTLLNQIEKIYQKTLHQSQTRISPIKINFSDIAQSESKKLIPLLVEKKLFIHENQIKKENQVENDQKTEFVILIDEYEDENYQQFLEILNQLQSRIILTINSLSKVNAFYNFLEIEKISFVKISLRLFSDQEILYYVQQHYHLFIKNMIHEHFKFSQNEITESFWKSFSLKLHQLQTTDDDNEAEQIINEMKNLASHTNFNKEETIFYDLIFNRVSERIQSKLFIRFLQDNVLYEIAQIPILIKPISILLINYRTFQNQKGQNINYLNLLMVMIHQRKNYNNQFKKWYFTPNFKNINKLQSFFLALQFDEILNQLLKSLENNETDSLININDQIKFQQINFLLDEFKDITLFLKHCYKNNQQAIYKLLQCVKASAVIINLEQIAGNALYILNSMQLTIRNENFTNIKIINSSMDSMLFSKCNFKNSKMINIDISSTNFIECNLENISWEKLILNSQVQAIYQRGYQSIQFSSESKPIVVKPGSLFLKQWSDGKQLLKPNMPVIHVFAEIDFNEKNNTIIKFSIMACLKNHNLQQIQIRRVNNDINNKLIRKFNFSPRPEVIHQILLSQDGKFLAALCYAFLFCWDLQQGKIVFFLDNVLCSSIAFKNNILVFSTNQKVQLQDLKVNKCLKKLESKCEKIFIKDDGQILAGCNSKSLQLWNLKTWKMIKEIKLPKWTLISILPDWKRFALGLDRIIKIFNFENGKEIQLLKGHQEKVVQIICSPDGKILASDDTIEIRLWGIDQLCESNYDGHSLRITQVDISSDGRFLLSCSHDGSIRLWNFEDRKLIKCFQQAGQSIECARFCFDYHGYIYGNGKGRIYIQDFNQNTFQEFYGHNQMVNKIMFSSDGEILASSGDEKKIILQKTKETHLINTFDCLFSPCFAFTKDFKVLACLPDQYTIQIWDTQNIRDKKMMHQIKGGFSNISVLAFSIDNQVLFSASEEKLQLWNINTGEKICEKHTKKVVAVAFSPDGKIFASGSWDYTISLWNFDNFSLTQLIKDFSGYADSIQFSQDGYFLVYGDLDKTIKTWSLKQYQKQVLNKSQLYSSKSSELILQSTISQAFNIHQQDINYKNVKSIIYLKNEQKIVSIYQDNQIIVWDEMFRKRIYTLKGHSEKIFSISISKMEKLLASAGIDQIIIIWSLESYQAKFKLKGHSDTIFSVVFSPNEKLLASGGKDMIFNIWDIQLGQCIQRVRWHENWICGISFSFDGQYLVTCSKDKKIRLWITNYINQPPQVLQLCNSETLTIQFSPNSLLLAIGYLNGLIHIYDVCKQSIIYELQEHKDRINSIAFSQDGRLLASGSSDSTLRLWKLDHGLQIRCIYNQGQSVTSVQFISDIQQICYTTGDGKFIKENIYPLNPRFELNSIIGDRILRSYNCTVSNALIQSKNDLDITSLFKQNI